MISETFDFTEFLQAITDKDFLEMLEISEQECIEAERFHLLSGTQVEAACRFRPGICPVPPSLRGFDPKETFHSFDPGPVQGIGRNN